MIALTKSYSPSFVLYTSKQTCTLLFCIFTIDIARVVYVRIFSGSHIRHIEVSEPI